MLLPEQPALQPIKVDVDDWRCVKRKYLRESKAADNGVAERLADFRSDAGTDHHRDGTEESRHRGHEDRPETLDASLIDRLLGRQTFVLFSLQGKVHQHDAVLLDDADKQDDANDRDDAEVEVSRHQE